MNTVNTTGQYIASCKAPNGSCYSPGPTLDNKESTRLDGRPESRGDLGAPLWVHYRHISYTGTHNSYHCLPWTSLVDYHSLAISCHICSILPWIYGGFFLYEEGGGGDYRGHSNLRLTIEWIFFFFQILLPQWQPTENDYTPTISMHIIPIQPCQERFGIPVANAASAHGRERQKSTGGNTTEISRAKAI